MITTNEVIYYIEVCLAWRSGEYTSEEMEIEFPGLSQQDACHWSLYGFSPQQWLTIEWMFKVLMAYGEKTALIIESQNAIAKDRYKIILEGYDAIEKANEPPAKEPSFWDKITN